MFLSGYNYVFQLSNIFLALAVAGNFTESEYAAESDMITDGNQTIEDILQELAAKEDIEGDNPVQ